MIKMALYMLNLSFREDQKVPGFPLLCPQY